MSAYLILSLLAVVPVTVLGVYARGTADNIHAVLYLAAMLAAVSSHLAEYLVVGLVYGTLASIFVGARASDQAQRAARARNYP